MGCKVKEFIPNHQIFELQKEISNQQCNKNNPKITHTDFIICVGLTHSFPL